MAIIKYAKVEDGIVTKYPYSVMDLKIDNPNVSFPGLIDESIKNTYKMFAVQEIEKPEDYTKNIIEDIPKYINGALVQVWNVQDASEEEITQRISNQWIEVRDERNVKLTASDWTQLPDSPLTEEQKNAWRQYRQELRDITNQANPFEIIFPVQP